MNDTLNAIPAYVQVEIGKAIEPLQQRIAQLEREVAELKCRAPTQPGILERLVRRSGATAS